MVGTVHTPSAQQDRELDLIISQARPDIVLLELDQERLDTLTTVRGGSYGVLVVVVARPSTLGWWWRDRPLSSSRGVTAVWRSGAAIGKDSYELRPRERLKRHNAFP